MPVGQRELLEEDEKVCAEIILPLELLIRCRLLCLLFSQAIPQTLVN